MLWFVETSVAIRNVNTRSRIRIFHLGSRIKKIPDPGSGFASKNLSIFNPKIVSKLSEKLSRIRILIFYPSRTPDLGVKKAPNPGSGSATLVETDSAVQELLELVWSWFRWKLFILATISDGPWRRKNTEPVKAYFIIVGPLLLIQTWILDHRFGIRDGNKSGSGINIPDQQHWKGSNSYIITPCFLRKV